MLIQERADLKRDIREDADKAESLVFKGGNNVKTATAWESLVPVEKDKLSTIGG